MERYCVCFDEDILLYFIFDEQEDEQLTGFYDTENDARLAILNLIEGE